MTKERNEHGRFKKPEPEVDRKKIRREALDKFLMDETRGVWHVFMRLAKNPKPQEIYHCRSLILDLYKEIVRGNDEAEGRNEDK